MDIGAISVGPDPPKDIYAVIEIPLGGAPVKYELDKASGALIRRSLRRAGRYAGAGGAGGDRALPAGGRTADGRRGWSRRKNHRSAGRRACPLLRGHSQLPRSAADHVRADRALLSALQGHTRGDRARRKGASEGGRQAKGHAGTHSTNWRPTEGTVEKMTKIISRLSRPIAGHQTRSRGRLGARRNGDSRQPLSFGKIGYRH